MERLYSAEKEKFLGRTAIISGGGGDIGGTIALELAQQGADIAIGDIKEVDEVEPLLIKLRNLGKKVLYVTVDISNSEAVKNWISAVEFNLGIPDVIVSCAAQVTIKDIKSITPEEWKKEIDVDLNGSFYLASACALRLLETKRVGHIVFIGSGAGRFPQRHNPAYGVAKAGLSALTRVMTLEFAPHGILTNEIAPGNVNAGLSKKHYEQHPGHMHKDVKLIPTGRLVEAKEIAKLVAFLCSSENKNITGATYFIDGGMSSLPDFVHLRKLLD